MIPYARQSIDEDDIAAVVAVLRSDFLTQGPAVERFEQALVEKTGARYAVAVSSGTAALHLACLALGLGPGKRLWTSPNTFVASANCARYCGADVDFVDIDPATLNMSIPALERRLEQAERQGTLPHVVVSVDFAGLPCDYDALVRLAQRYGFALLEDAAHATGARYRGHPVGSIPGVDATVMSFHPVKTITTGEGGVVLTDNPHLARTVRELRHHGITRDRARMTRMQEDPWVYEQIALGFNYRLTDIQAALGTSQLGKLEGFLKRRRWLAARYDERLAVLPVILPPRDALAESSWHLYPIRLRQGGDKRRKVFDALKAAGIGVNVHYIPVHYHDDFQRLGFRRGDYPETERYYGAALSLPLFPALGESEQDYIVDRLADSLAGS